MIENSQTKSKICIKWNSPLNLLILNLLLSLICKVMSFIFFVLIISVIQILKTSLHSSREIPSRHLLEIHLVMIAHLIHRRLLGFHHYKILASHWTAFLDAAQQNPLAFIYLSAGIKQSAVVKVTKHLEPIHDRTHKQNHITQQKRPVVVDIFVDSD